ncbi:MAG: major facilitator superfamily MFS1 [Parcubacteria group bacterium Gr01-1014_56]|nr:MAG: major facilitator superfamily MFS1 [Parcubacteria group bacterium Gr01-1014_56]
MVRLNRNIIAYYAFNFLIGFYLANGTTVLFEQRLGLSYSQIFTLDAVYMLMFILFEIPSGAIADLVGRKKTILAGIALLCLGALATGNAHTFFQLFLTFFIWAFGFSLISGSSEAMLYDTLHDEKLYHRVFGRAWSFSIIGMALSGVVGPLLFEQYFRLPYLLSAIPFAAALVAMLFFKESIIYKKRFSFNNHWHQMKEGTRLAFSNRFVLWSMAALSLVFAVGYTFTSAYQPYLIIVGFSVAQFSFILPIMFTMEAVGGGWSQKLTTFFGERAAFWFSFLLIGLSLLVLGVYASKTVASVLFLYSFLQGFLRPLVSTYANRYIDSNFRATIVSVQGMVSTITASAILFSFGFLTDRIGVVALTTLIGVMVLVAGIILLLLKPKNS